MQSFINTPIKNTQECRRAVFIDRDGVINEERNYVVRQEDFVLLPGAIEGLKMLQAAGFLLIVVTNQAGIGRGYFSEEAYERLTSHMCNLLAENGVNLTAIYHSPYHPIHGLGHYLKDSDCRKPKPGMLLRAQGDWGIDLRYSILIGDKDSDIEAGRAADLGCCLLVRTGHPVTPACIAFSDGCYADLREAAQWIVNQ